MLYLGYWTALEMWRSIRGMGVKAVEATLSLGRTRPCAGAALRARRADCLRIADEYSLALPLQVVVSKSRRCRKRSEVLECHLCGNGSYEYLEIADDVYLSSPESLFMQMGSLLDTIDLIRLAYELTSIFAHDKSSRLIPSVPLASIDSLLAACNQESMSGNKRDARLALRHAKGFAASAPEIELSMKLSLPYRWGGLNVKGIELNPPIEISEEAQGICGKSFCKPDIYCPDIRYDVEYQSSLFHSSPDKIEEDARRRMALEHDGIKVRNVTLKEMKSRDDLFVLAKEISRLRGQSIKIRSKDFETSQNELFARFVEGSLVTQIPRL